MDHEAVRDRLSSQLFAPHDEEFLRAIEEGTAGTSIREDLEVDPDSILEDVRVAREELGQVNQTPQFGDIFGSLTGGFGGYSGVFGGYPMSIDEIRRYLETPPGSASDPQNLERRTTLATVGSSPRLHERLFHDWYGGPRIEDIPERLQNSIRNNAVVALHQEGAYDWVIQFRNHGDGVPEPDIDTAFNLFEEWVLGDYWVEDLVGVRLHNNAFELIHRYTQPMTLRSCNKAFGITVFHSLIRE